MQADGGEDDVVVELNFGQPRISGRNPTLHAAYQRDLSSSDMAALSAPRGVEPAQLKTLRASHHALAKCIASGMRNYQVALVTGYSAERISFLQRDPTFCALVNDYRMEQREIFGDLAQRMANVSLDALEVLQERLTDNPEQFSTGMLLDVVKAFADRTGHGPGQEVNLNVRTGDIIDRPPKETHEQWLDRRAKELEGSEGTSVVPPGGASDRRDNG